MLWRDTLGVGFLFEEGGKDTSPSPRASLLLLWFPSPRHPFPGELGPWGKPGVLGGWGVSWPGSRTCWHVTAAAGRVRPTDLAVSGPAATGLAHGEPLWVPSEAFESQHLCYEIRCQLIEGGCGAIHCVLANALFVTYINPHTYVSIWRSHQNPILMLFQRVWEMGYYKCGVWNTNATSCWTHRK